MWRSRASCGVTQPPMRGTSIRPTARRACSSGWPSRWSATTPARRRPVREGLDETLTVQRLGLTGALQRTLRTTNIIENLNGSVERYTRNVKRWRGGQVIQRWGGERAGGGGEALPAAGPGLPRCAAPPGPARQDRRRTSGSARSEPRPGRSAPAGRWPSAPRRSRPGSRHIAVRAAPRRQSSGRSRAGGSGTRPPVRGSAAIETGRGAGGPQTGGSPWSRHRDRRRESPGSGAVAACRRAARQPVTHLCALTIGGYHHKVST